MFLHKAYRWPSDKQQESKQGWTSNKPTEDGFYWLQQMEEHKTIVEIDGRSVWWIGGDGKDHLRDIEGQWQGPLQPPSFNS